jgi:hypothetical protein
MSLVHGVTAGQALVPLLVDASGRALIATDGTGLVQLSAGTAHVGQVSLDAALPAGGNLIGDVQARGLGYISGAWQKQPIPFGLSGAVRRTLNSADLAAGTNNLDDSAVPAGEYWIITGLAMRYTGTVTNVELRFQVNSGGTQYVLAEVDGLTSSHYKNYQGAWPVLAGENLRLAVLGATLHDTANLYATGYRVDIDL